MSASRRAIPPSVVLSIGLFGTGRGPHESQIASHGLLCQIIITT